MEKSLGEVDERCRILNARERRISSATFEQKLPGAENNILEPHSERNG